MDRLANFLDVGLGPRHHRYKCALARKRLGDAETDSLRRRGDERDLPRDAEVHSRILLRCCPPEPSTMDPPSRPDRRRRCS